MAGRGGAGGGDGRERGAARVPGVRRSVESVLTLARRAAQRRGRRSPTTVDLLWALFEADEGCRATLSGAGVREADLLRVLRETPDEHDTALDLALERARRLAGGGAVAPAQLLSALARDARSTAGRCLAGLALPGGSPGGKATRRGPSPRPAVRPRTPAPREAPPRPLASRPRPPDRGSSSAPAGSDRARSTPDAPSTPDVGSTTAARGDDRSRRIARGAVRGRSASAGHALDPERFPLLARLGRNLTAAAAAGALDPVLGREVELERLVDVLLRRRGNNPVLVGPPGVGKTALVEGLARHLLEEPDADLRERIVVEVTPSAFLEGTGVRGALGERLRALRAELDDAGGRVWLFVDEIHALVAGPGDGGPDDLATLLKPALARGELPCIGATTEEEYARVFERDPALSRRFSPVHVDEPSPEATRAILRRLEPVYARHHGRPYAPDAVDAAVDWTVAYQPERRLPDKAIGALDLAGARARRRGLATVDRAVVAEVVAEAARVPVDRLLSTDRARLVDLEVALRARIVGQDDALARVADVVRRGAAGLRGDGPLGTFLFLGPTGVGKTETAKALAELVFGHGYLTRFDLSELSEAHGVARLLGAPPGYVGHDAGGQLTEAVRRRPHQVVLLDEIEKAHPEVLLALLPMLDEGRLTDGRGRTVDFRQTLIVLTSNLGAAEATRGGAAPIGFGAAPQAPSDRGARALASARAALPPELWNRIDEPIAFRPLDRGDVAQVAARLVEGVAERLVASHGVTLALDPEALGLLVEEGFDPLLGVRPLRRAVSRLLEAPLATALLAGRLGRGARVRVRRAGSALRLEGPAEASMGAEGSAEHGPVSAGVGGA